MVEGGLGPAAEHAGEFVDAGGAFDALEQRAGPALRGFLGDEEMRPGLAGYLRQVGDGHDLVGAGQRSQFGPDSGGDLAADIGVDFVEEQDRHGIVVSQHRLDGEHHPRDLAAGGDEPQRLGGLAGVRHEQEIDGFGAVRVERAGCQHHLELRPGEPEVGEVGRDLAGELGGGLAAFGAEAGGGGAGNLGGGGGGVLQAGQFLVAVFDAGQAGGGLLLPGDHVGQGGAILALEGFDQVDPILQGLGSGRIEVEFGEVAGEGAGQFLQFHRGGGQALERLGHRRVEFLKFTGQPLYLAEPVEDGFLRLRQQTRHRAGRLREPGAVGGPAVALDQVGLFVGAQACGIDLMDLVAQQLEFLLRRALRVPQDLEGVARLLPGLPGRGIGRAVGFRPGPGVEHAELAVAGKQRLVVVRAVEVDELVAELPHDLERGRRAIGELAVGSGGGEGSFQHQLPAIAGLDPRPGQDGVEAGGIGQLENRFDRALVGPRAQQGAVGPVAQDQREGPQDDGLAGPGLAGDGDEARAGFPGQAFDEGQVLDAKVRQHGLQRVAECATTSIQRWQERKSLFSAPAHP